MTVIDSDVIIEFLRNRRPASEQVTELLQAGRAALSAISVAELVQGATSTRQQAAIERLLALVVVLPFDVRAANMAGRIRRGLGGAGQDIGLADCAIAATCLVEKRPLWTLNRRHFARVAGLTLQA